GIERRRQRDRGPFVAAVAAAEQVAVMTGHEDRAARRTANAHQRRGRISPGRPEVVRRRRIPAPEENARQRERGSVHGGHSMQETREPHIARAGGRTVGPSTEGKPWPELA